MPLSRCSMLDRNKLSGDGALSSEECQSSLEGCHTCPEQCQNRSDHPLRSGGMLSAHWETEGDGNLLSFIGLRTCHQDLMMFRAGDQGGQVRCLTTLWWSWKQCCICLSLIAGGIVLEYGIREQRWPFVLYFIWPRGVFWPNDSPEIAGCTFTDKPHCYTYSNSSLWVDNTLWLFLNVDLSRCMEKDGGELYYFSFAEGSSFCAPDSRLCVTSHWPWILNDSPAVSASIGNLLM